MSKENKLKPCPFCGGEAKLVLENWCRDMQFDADHDTAVVVCKKCKSRGTLFECKNARYRPTCNQELDAICKNAIHAWNKRMKGEE